MASDNEETQSQSGSVAFNHGIHTPRHRSEEELADTIFYLLDQIPTLYINPDDFEGDDDDELSVWTVDTQGNKQPSMVTLLFY
jgi:hypothetical protein